MSETKFYICEHCGNIIGKIHDAGVPVVCCGQKMTQMIPGTVEASLEKHIPVAAVEGSLVKVEIGSVAHPMVEEHYIPWECIQRIGDDIILIDRPIQRREAPGERKRRRKF